MTYYLLFLPEILLAACACGLLLFDRFLATRHKIVNLYCTLAILFAIGAALALTIAHQPAEVFGQHFVVEFMVIIASFKAQPLYAFIAALTLILGAAYTLWMVKRVIFGEASNSVSALADIGLREWTVLAILAALILLLGFWPHLLTQLMHPSVEQLLYHIMASKVPLT